MNSIETFKNNFINLKSQLNFPNTTYCGKYFNKIFQEGNSIQEFETYCKSIATKVQTLEHPNFKKVVQYIFRSDIWGPKETVLIHKEPRSPEYDIVIRFDVRDPREFPTVLNYLKSVRYARLLSEKPGNVTLDITNNRPSGDRREVVFNVIRGNEQSTEIVLLLNFCEHYNRYQESFTTQQSHRNDLLSLLRESASSTKVSYSITNDSLIYQINDIRLESKMAVVASSELIGDIYSVSYIVCKEHLEELKAHLLSNLRSLPPDIKRMFALASISTVIVKIGTKEFTTFNTKVR